jgi:hypothetical protein
VGNVFVADARGTMITVLETTMTIFFTVFSECRSVVSVPREKSIHVGKFLSTSLIVFMTK